MRPSVPATRSSAAAYEPRAIAEADVEVAYALRCEWAAEGAPPPKQLDRWGPGLPVFVPPEDDPDASRAYELTPPEPGQATRHGLAAVVRAGDAGGILAWRDGVAIGLVTYAVVGHPAQPGEVGTIDMLYVRREHRRRGVATRLVREALDALRRRHVHVFRAEYDGQDRAAERFWRSLGWRSAGISYLHE